LITQKLFFGGRYVNKPQGLTLPFYTTFQFGKYISNFSFHLKILLSKLECGIDCTIYTTCIYCTQTYSAALSILQYGRSANAGVNESWKWKIIPRWLFLSFDYFFCVHFPLTPYPDRSSILVHFWFFLLSKK